MTYWAYVIAVSWSQNTYLLDAKCITYVVTYIEAIGPCFAERWSHLRVLVSVIDLYPVGTRNHCVNRPLHGIIDHYRICWS